MYSDTNTSYQLLVTNIPFILPKKAKKSKKKPYFSSKLLFLGYTQPKYGSIDIKTIGWYTLVSHACHPYSTVFFYVYGTTYD